MATAKLVKIGSTNGRTPPVEVEEDMRPISKDQHDLVVRYSLVAIVVILMAAVLAITKEITLPIAAGIIFGMVLGPVVDWMVAKGVPQHAAAALVVLAMIGLMGAATALLALPAASWSGQLPQMVAVLQSKFSGAFAFLHAMGQAPAAATLQPGTAVPTAAGNGLADLVKSLPLTDIALGSSAAIAGLLLFVATIYFYLATRRHLKARILRLCLGREARKSAGHFFEKIEERVATYLGLVTIVNIVCGILAMGIAWGAGLSYPIFWGAFAMIMNYLPFVGPAIVIAMLFAANLLSAQTLIGAAIPAALYLVVHLFESNLITPMIVGKRLTMSPFLVFISFIFWLWLWGPVGAVLATPFLIAAIVARETFSEYREAVSENEASPT